ncbi:BQ2448_4305 [Microbotryum intermedium]|uniref:BQ2448_4305 protein n=1 Tax=Microbotryum intermedium TaxID=269621 RepID=A0A238FNJ0_9BASI|nr:BQ2448_4305 [Microbotryum intermedium]
METAPSGATSHPLRPYATSLPAQDWSFPSSSSSSGGPNASSSGSSSLRGLSAPSSPNRYASTTTLDGFDGSSGSSPAAGSLLKAFAMSSILSFSGTALVMPFEVGKTLAQVQWVPKDGLEPPNWATQGEAHYDQDEETIEASLNLPPFLSFRGRRLEDEAEAEAYFSDLSNISRPGFKPPTSGAPPRSVSPSGYLRRDGVVDERSGTKPEWIMPVVVQGGVWDMIKHVGRWKGEGWASLWKGESSAGSGRRDEEFADPRLTPALAGQLTTCILDAITTSIQPIFFSALSFAFLPSSALSALPLIYTPRPLPLLFLSTISHALANLVVSPLDLVRTRLIVQSAQPQHRKYAGPYDALLVIMREEGGLWTTYFHPNLFIPALLEGVARPLVHLSTPLIISRYFHLELSTSPISFGLAELVLGTAGLLITIPIETVRKRLQLQSRAEFVRAGRAGGTGRPWRTCVETRPVGYAGVVEAVYRILTEETGRIPRRRKIKRSSSSSSSSGGGGGASTQVVSEPVKEDLGLMGLGAGSGLTQLYRGFGMGVGANFVVFVLGLVAGGTEASGWSEM